MEEKKLSYEELEKVATELSAQNRQLSMQVNNLYGQMQNMANMFKRLDYLFKVLEFETSFKGEFVNACVDEIVELMTPPKQAEGEEEAKDGVAVEE